MANKIKNINELDSLSHVAPEDKVLVFDESEKELKLALYREVRNPGIVGIGRAAYEALPVKQPHILYVITGP